MRNLFALLTLVLVLSILALTQKDTRDNSIAISHVTLIDGTGSSAQPDMTVVIIGNRIASIGHAKPPKNSRTIDARGKFLIPGLWDMHVHLAGISADPKWSRATLLPLLIANGITGVRDMGGDLDALQSWRADIDSGRLVGPHIFAAGPMLDRGRAQGPEMVPVLSPDDARKAVDSLKARRADFVKVLSRLDRDSYFAIADESKKQGLSFVGHVPDAITAIEASNAGQKSIEHIMYSNLAFDCSAREAVLRARRIEAQAKRDSSASAQIRNEANDSFSKEKAAALWKTLIRNDTWVVPTLAGTYATAHQLDASKKADDPRLTYLPADLRKQWSYEEIAKQVSPGAVEWYTRQFANDMKLAGAMHDAGVKMMAGSDSLDPYNFPGDSLHQEFELFVKVGFTPMQALQAATRNPAVFMNKDDSYGTIQKGRIADLVLLNANPLEEIKNTRTINSVVVNGKLLDRTALDRMLQDAREAAGSN